MKTLYFLLLLLTISFSEKTFGQELSTASLLVGTWAFDYDKSLKEMDVPSKLNLDTLPKFQRESVEKNYRGRLMTFKKNGNYEQVLASGTKAIGTWTVNENEKLIIITNPYGNEYKQKIKIITSAELVLQPMIEGENKMLVPEWVLFKTK